MLAFVLAATPLLAAARPAQAAATFTVTTTGDGSDRDLADPVCDAGNLGNADDAVDTRALGVIIGGDTAADANVLAFNGETGSKSRRRAPASASCATRSSATATSASTSAKTG